MGCSADRTVRGVQSDARQMVILPSLAPVHTLPCTIIIDRVVASCFILAIIRYGFADSAAAARRPRAHALSEAVWRVRAELPTPPTPTPTADADADEEEEEEEAVSVGTGGRTVCRSLIYARPAGVDAAVARLLLGA